MWFEIEQVELKPFKTTPNTANQHHFLTSHLKMTLKDL
jgi:hypothetical protein